MTSSNLTFRPADEAGMRLLGEALARQLGPGMRVYLSGSLGSGKTFLVRAVLRALGHTGGVKSPTYTLVEIYVISGYIAYHFDFYRFNDPAEWREAGLDEYFNTSSLCLVEWPEKASGVLPVPDLMVRIDFSANDDPQARTVVIEGLSERGTSCLDALRLNFPKAPA